MSKPKGFKEISFPKVKEAREALKARAMELFDLQIQIILAAVANKDYESASKANQWLLDHIPADDGVRMFDGSVDKEVSNQGQLGPTIQIGIALGAAPEPKALPPATIEGEVIKHE